MFPGAILIITTYLAALNCKIHQVGHYGKYLPCQVGIKNTYLVFLYAHELGNIK